MSWTAFILCMLGSVLVSVLVAKLLTRGPALPPAPPPPRPLATPTQSAPHPPTPDGWGDDADGPRAGRKRGTLAMPVVGGAAAAGLDPALAFESPSPAVADSSADATASRDHEGRGGRRRATLVGAAAQACPRHPDKKVEWTCRFCKTDYCRDCRLQVDDVVCCPRQECRERAQRFAAARRTRG